MRSTACWSSDARAMPASDEPRRDCGSCVLPARSMHHAGKRSRPSRVSVTPNGSSPAPSPTRSPTAAAHSGDAGGTTSSASPSMTCAATPTASRRESAACGLCTGPCHRSAAATATHPPRIDGTLVAEALRHAADSRSPFDDLAPPTEHGSGVRGRRTLRLPDELLESGCHFPAAAAETSRRARSASAAVRAGLAPLASARRVILGSPTRAPGA